MYWSRVWTGWPKQRAVGLHHGSRWPGSVAVRSAPDAVHVCAERRCWRRRRRNAVGLPSDGERRSRSVDRVHRRRRTGTRHADAEQWRQWRQHGRRGPSKSAAAATQTPTTHIVVRAPTPRTAITAKASSSPLSPAQPAQPFFGLNQQLPKLLYDRRRFRGRLHVVLNVNTLVLYSTRFPIIPQKLHAPAKVTPVEEGGLRAISPLQK